MTPSDSGQRRYITYKQKDATMSGFFSIFFLCCWCGICFSGQELFETKFPYVIQILVALLCVGWFAYTATYNSKRIKYKERGQKLNGYILEAERKEMGRGGSQYFLLIAFHDNGSKIKYSEGYADNPNDYLKSRRCSIYKYKDKYIEADFICADDSESSGRLNIPISKYRRDSRKKYV